MRTVQNEIGRSPGKLRSAWIRISWCFFSGYLLSAQASAVVTANILAGGETDLPADTRVVGWIRKGCFHLSGRWRFRLWWELQRFGGRLVAGMGAHRRP